MVDAAEDAERQANHQMQLGGNPGSTGLPSVRSRTFVRTAKQAIWRTQTRGAPPPRTRREFDPSRTFGGCSGPRFTGDGRRGPRQTPSTGRQPVLYFPLVGSPSGRVERLLRHGVRVVTTRIKGGSIIGELEQDAQFE